TTAKIPESAPAARGRQSRSKRRPPCSSCDRRRSRRFPSPDRQAVDTGPLSRTRLRFLRSWFLRISLASNLGGTGGLTTSVILGELHWWTSHQCHPMLVGHFSYVLFGDDEVAPLGSGKNW